MKVYFNSIGQFLEQDTTMDLFVKGNNGNVVECYFKDLDLSNKNLKFRMVIKWADGSTTNELLMNKSILNDYVFLTLPTLKIDGLTEFIVKIYNYEILQQTAIFERKILESIDAKDTYEITDEQYNVLISSIEELNNDLVKISVDNEEIKQGLKQGIQSLAGVLSEKQILEIFYDKVNYSEGKYSIKSEEYGDEIIIVNREKELFKRFTGGYDYTFDFKEGYWKIASGGGTGGGGNGTVTGSVVLTPISSLEQTVAVNSPVKLKFNVDFSLYEQGTLQIYVGEVLKRTKTINKGDNEIDVTDYLYQGDNNVKIVVNDLTGASASLIYQINVIVLKLTSSFNDSRAYNGEIDFRFIPYGAVEKTVEFYVDGAKYNTQRIMETGTTQQQIIEPLGHGIHTLKVVMYATVGTQYVEADELNYNLTYTEEVVEHLHSFAIKQKEYGARPIIRLIQDKIEDQITDLMLKNEYEENYTFVATYENEGIIIK